MLIPIYELPLRIEEAILNAKLQLYIYYVLITNLFNITNFILL